MAGADPVSDFLRLTDVEWRRRHEAASGMFVAEGEKVINRAFALGYRPRQVLAAEKWLQRLPPALLAAAEVVVAEPSVLEQTTGYRVHRGALASFDRPEALAFSKLLQAPGALVLLEGLVDLENLGAIFRSAAGLGVGGILLSSDCADPVYRRAVKASMGATLALPHAVYPDWRGLHDQLRATGRRLVAMTPAGGRDLTAVADLVDPERLVLALGSEGEGLSEMLLAGADDRIAIPMSRGTDSLNVAAAAAIAIWEIAARRRPAAGSNRL